MEELTYQEFANVWDAIADTPEEAASLTLRSQLMDQIMEIVKQAGWTQAEAAKQCGVTQTRIKELQRGRISEFSVDSLIDIATALGYRVTVRLEVT